MIAKDTDGNVLTQGDMVEINYRPKTTGHPWLRVGARFTVERIEDRSFQGEKPFNIVFLRTLKGGQSISQGIEAIHVRRLINNEI